MIEVKAKVELLPENLAEMFWQLGDDEQARFFNQLGEHCKGIKFPLQMSFVDSCGLLNKNGRVAMLHIGEFGI